MNLNDYVREVLISSVLRILSASVSVRDWSAKKLVQLVNERSDASVRRLEEKRGLL